MLELIIGVKGTGKTKQLIEMVHAALAASNGNVVCIEKGDKLRFDVNYQCRLIDAEHYSISDAEALYGFISGIIASNHDVTDLFVDSALKICKDDLASFDPIIDKVAALSEKCNVRIVMTLSMEAAAATDTIKKYL